MPDITNYISGMSHPEQVLETYIAATKYNNIRYKYLDTR